MSTASSMSMLWLILTLFLQEVSAFFDIDEINSVHYGIDILDQPVVMTEEPHTGSVFLASKYGQQYQCTYAEKSLEDELKEKEEEKVALEKGIADLLKPMENGPCLVNTKGWWTYEFCFGKNIKQYHVEDGKITGNVLYLGHYSSDYDWANTTNLRKQKSWLSRYHTQQYINGTDCDLTTKSRRTEVRFYCEKSQGDYISRVDETETCVYTLSVQTSRICNHPYLKPPTPQRAVPITCNPLLSQQDFQEYTTMQANIEAEKRMRQKVIVSRNAASQLGSITDFFDEDEEGTLTNQDAGDEDESLVDGISRSLIEGIKEVFGEKSQDRIQVKSMKVRPVKTTGDLNDILRQALQDEETEAELDDLEEEHEGQITEMDMDSEGKDVADMDEDEEDGTIENEDEEYIIDFDKELDEFVESEGHLQQIKDYKETLQKEVGERFDQILDEAKAELAGDLDDDIDLNSEEVTKTMSDTLTKLIKQLESKTTTGKTKSASAKLDMDTRQKSEGSSQSSPESPAEEPSITSQPFEGSSQTDPDDNEFGEEDYVNVEYDLEYGDHKIQVKIFTTADYYEEATADMLESGTELNKMIVAVLGGNTEEIQEAKKQNELESNYGFVWNKDKKAKTKDES